MADVLLTDEQYLHFVTEAVELQIKYGFVRAEDKDEEIDFLFTQYTRNKPYVLLN